MITDALMVNLSQAGFEGDIDTSMGARQRYATDGSVYEVLPYGVVFPKSTQDIQRIVHVAARMRLSVTARGAGTSLAGQAIGDGIIIDMTRYMTSILDINIEQRTVTVQPGVVLDTLNQTLKAHNLWLPIDTSTANRCVMGGVVGNNSCGAYSLTYRTPREHIVSLTLVGHDASIMHLAPVLDAQAFEAKKKNAGLEGHIYQTLDQVLTEHHDAIIEAFPDPSLIRRNTGYALDALLTQSRWSTSENTDDASSIYANLAPLVCGSEGTLGIATDVTFNLSPLPKARALLVFHFDDIFQALDATPALIASGANAVELIDDATLSETEKHAGLSHHRFWLLGHPQAVQVVEYFADSINALEQKLDQGKALAVTLLANGCYAAAVVRGSEMASVWEIRKAGLGLLMGKAGKKKAVAVIEDAAVPIVHLSAFMRDIRQLMLEQGVGCIYYGHASVGLIHLRPELDLSDMRDKRRFEKIAARVSTLVKHYHGSLSGEHGDGRLRAPFLGEQFGPTVFSLLKHVKNTFDPYHRMNPGKIIATQLLTSDMRQAVSHVATLKRNGFDWVNSDGGFGLAVEKCNGAGACRKSTGAMCPTFQATHDDAESTRGRANLLRFALQHVNPVKAMKSADLQQALSTCLGCKACYSECPASVDMAKLKAEVLFQTQNNRWSINRFVLRHYAFLLPILSRFRRLVGTLNTIRSSLSRLGVWDKRRYFPVARGSDLQHWWLSEGEIHNPKDDAKSVILLIDPFTRYQHPERGIACIKVMQNMGLNVFPVWISDSTRLLISNGFLDVAKRKLSVQWSLCASAIQQHPEAFVVGIEPAELLVWRDDAMSLLSQQHQNALSQHMAKFMLWDEWLVNFAQSNSNFYWPKIEHHILLHVHCHQKALSQATIAQQCLSLIAPQVDLIDGGCCGMSGSFGYEQTDLSIKIAQQYFLPAIANMDNKTLLVTCGTSCHQQAKDLADTEGLHTAEVFAKAFNC